MRYLTYFTGERNRIDINNSLLGEESVFYNGTLVSRRTSLLGSVHEFMVKENGEETSYLVHINLRWPLRIGFDIFRNGKALLLS